MWQCLYENHRELPIKELNNVRCVKGIMKFNLTKLLCVFHTLNQHKQLKQLWGYCFGFVSIRIPPYPNGLSNKPWALKLTLRILVSSLSESVDCRLVHRRLKTPHVKFFIGTISFVSEIRNFPYNPSLSPVVIYKNKQLAKSKTKVLVSVSVVNTCSIQNTLKFKLRYWVM